MGGQPLVDEEVAHGQPLGAHPGPVGHGGQGLDSGGLGFSAGGEAALGDLAALAGAVGDVGVVGPGGSALADVVAARGHGCLPGSRSDGPVGHGRRGGGGDNPRHERPVAGEAIVEHRYPDALAFLREHGPDALAVLHVLAVDAQVVDGRLVARASTRGLAERLGFLSKDSAHRRLRQLRRAGVLEALPSSGPMDPPSYVLHLDGTGIAVTHHDPSR